ncbi:MAG TPA: TolC family protein [Vicinamibacteria bacterium]|nr:TolC family protein [Vicinamibacteria bacterium]
MRRVKRFPTWIAFGSCLALGYAASAQSEAQRLTVHEAAESALSYYPSISVSVARRESAFEAAREAEAERFPAVSLGASATQYQEPMIVHPLHALTPGQIPPFDRTLFQVSGQFSYTLFDGGARSSRIEATRAEERATEELVGEAGQSLLSLVIGAYLRALGLAQAVDAHDRSIAALEAELGRVRQLFDVGRAPQIEILRAEAAIAHAEAERVAVASSLDRAERDLARLTGAPVERTRATGLAPVSMVESSIPPRGELRDRALAATPALRAARQRLDAASAAVLAARSARFPDIMVGGNYVDYASGSGVNQLEWSLGLRVNYALFTGGAISGRIARAGADERRAAEEVRLVESQVEQDLDLALSGLDEARARVRSLTTAVRRFEEVVRIERLRLVTGAGTQTDYIRSEADLLGARADLIRAEYEVIFAWTELSRATGELDLEWIESHLRSAP